MGTLTVPHSTTFYHMYENNDPNDWITYCLCLGILYDTALDHLCRGISLHLHMSGTTTE